MRKRWLRWFGMVALLAMAGLAAMSFVMRPPLREIAEKIKLGMPKSQVIDLAGRPSEAVDATASIDGGAMQPVALVFWRRSNATLCVYLDLKTRCVVYPPCYGEADAGIIEIVSRWFRPVRKSGFPDIPPPLPIFPPPD
jgi:spore maturation protein SpmA